MWFDLHTHGLHPLEGVLAIHNCSSQELLADDDIELRSLQFCSVSLHPWSITPENVSDQLAWLQSVVHLPQVVAIGEIGLDKLRGASFFFQQEVLREIIGVAEKAQLPLILHQVKSCNELIALKKELRPTTPWILHGFRGKRALALSLLKQGFYLSYGLHYDAEALKATPLNRLFLESDTASLPIQQLYERAAQLRDCAVGELREGVLRNALLLFSR
ncbi:MAG: TatD family hydrolase [Phocaeicola sp.]